MRTRIAIYLTLLLLAGVAGYASYRWQSTHVLPDQAEGDTGGSAFDEVTDNVLQGMQRPEFSLPDLDGRLHHPSEWSGKVLVVNFWATWCPPCRKELPMFVQLQDRYKAAGLQFLGIAIDDPAAVREFLARTPVNFPILVSEDQGVAVAQDYGDSIGALPYTAIVDRSGHIVLTKPGELSRQQAEQTIEALLKP
jgi:peroxiredoxin